MTLYRILYTDGTSREITAGEALEHQLTLHAAGELQACNPPEHPCWQGAAVEGEAVAFFQQRHVSREGVE